MEALPLRAIRGLCTSGTPIKKHGRGNLTATRYHVLYGNPIDTTTPAGRMMMQMVGTFAEFERAMIRERTRAGLKAAAAKGRKGGRRPALNEDQKADIADNVLSGRKTGAEMARLYIVSQATITRTVAVARLQQEMKSV